MKELALGLVSFVALLHIWFMILEMFFWTKPIGLRAFKLTPEKAELTKVSALNQGLYNGFLAAGLLFGMMSGNYQMVSFLLVCIIVAGVVGAMSVSRKILVVQALPAVLALILYSMN